MTAVDHAVTDDDSGRREIRAGLAAMAVYFLGFGIWAAVAPLDAAVVAPGVVVVAGNRQTLQHREGGVVTRLLVREGQAVAEGELLVELSAPEVIARERALLSQRLDLEVQRARLTAEMTGASRMTTPPEWAALSPEDRVLADATLERHRATGSSWSAYGARIGGYQREIQSVGRQEALLREELASMQQLADEQLVPMTRVRALERGLAELQGRRAALSAAIASAQQERHEDFRTVEARLGEVQPQWIAARAQAEQMRLRAPAAGVVVGLSVHTVGGVVRPGERVLDVVPSGRELVIEAQVRPQDAEALAVGHEAQVRLTAYSGRDLPIVMGEIRDISADRFSDERTGQPYFLAHIAVPADELERITSVHGANPIRPGLPAEIVVTTRKRTALQFLFEPLNQVLWRSFREE